MPWLSQAQQMLALVEMAMTLNENQSVQTSH